MTERFMAVPRRTLVLAEKLRRTQRVVQFIAPGQFEVVEFPCSAFAGCVPVVLDAVSDWWDSMGSDAWPDPRLTETFRMPWPAVWAEWEDRSPLVRQYGMTLQRRGLLVRDVPKWRDWPLSRLMRWYGAKMTGTAAADVDSVCADYAGINVMVLCEELPNGEILSSRYVMVPYNPDGRRYETPNGVVMHGDPNDYGEARTGRDHTYGNSAVWRLFVALLNVRNIDVAEVDLPRADRRRAERQAITDKGPTPWIKYKTLCLTLPTKSSNGNGNNRTGGPASSIPFHLVRGHLADYRNGPGLFGKWRSVVWIPMHTRGFQKAGAIAKTYDAKIEIDADPSLQTRGGE
jgi:hypothetical protein